MQRAVADTAEPSLGQNRHADWIAAIHRQKAWTHSTCQGLSYSAHSAFRVVDAAIVAVTEHHASIHHRSQPSQHRAPAVALYVNEAQQLCILYVLARYIASVGGKEAG